MFFPLEAVLFDEYICFSERKVLLGSCCYSLLRFFDMKKIEPALEEQNLAVLAGLNAVEHKADIDTALPQARDAILATLELLKEIEPFGDVDKEEIRDAFSAENIGLAKRILTDKFFDAEFYTGQLSLFPELVPVNVLQLQAAEAADRIKGLLEFYSALFDEIPQTHHKLRHVAERYSLCDCHNPAFLFALAFLEFKLDTTVLQKKTYTPFVPGDDHSKAIPGKTIRFRSYSDLITTELFEGLLLGHYPRICRVCGTPFLMTDKRNQKYCDGLSPFKDKRGNRLTCRQYAKKNHVPENAANDPYKELCRKRCEVLRSEKNRGTITAEFEEMAKLLAREHLCRALSEPDYAQEQYREDMDRTNLYKETAERLKQCRLTA